MISGSVPTDLRFGSGGSFSFTGSMTTRFVPVRVCRFVSVRGHTVYVNMKPAILGASRCLEDMEGMPTKAGLRAAAAYREEVCLLSGARNDDLMIRI